MDEQTKKNGWLIKSVNVTFEEWGMYVSGRLACPAVISNLKR
jgi:hypothetical protein